MRPLHRLEIEADDQHNEKLKFFEAELEMFKDLSRLAVLSMLCSKRYGGVSNVRGNGSCEAVRERGVLASPAQQAGPPAQNLSATGVPGADQPGRQIPHNPPGNGNRFPSLIADFYPSQFGREPCTDHSIAKDNLSMQCLRGPY